MSRRRPRARSARTIPTVLVIAMLLFGVSVLPATSYSTAAVDRGASMGVADDPDAALGLVIADNVSIDTREQLVTVTNRLGEDVTVTVSLADGSTSKGTLAVDGGETGDTVSFALATGASQQVDVDVANESAYVGDSLVFHVQADGTTIDATADDRQTEITE